MARFKDNDLDSIGHDLCVQWHIDNSNATNETEAYAACAILAEWRDLILADATRTMRDCSDWITAHELAGTWEKTWYKGLIFTFKLTMPNSIRRAVFDGLTPTHAAQIICSGAAPEHFTGAELSTIRPTLGDNVTGIYYANDGRHFIDAIS